MAMTIDGRIAKHADHNVDWTSKADKKLFVSETKKHGVMIMGSTTFKAIGSRALPNRLNYILTSDPEKFKDKEQAGLLEFAKGSPQKIVDNLTKKDFQSAILAGGAKTNSAFFEAGLVDEVMVTVEPKIFGQGMNITEGQDFDLNLELIESKEIGDGAVLLHYKVIK